MDLYWFPYSFTWKSVAYTLFLTYTYKLNLFLWIVFTVVFTDNKLLKQQYFSVAFTYKMEYWPHLRYSRASIHLDWFHQGTIKYRSTPEESCSAILLESVTFRVIQCYEMITIVIIIFCLTLELLASIPSVNFWSQKRLLIFVLFTVSEETDDICFIYSFSLLNMLPCLWDFHEPW